MKHRMIEILKAIIDEFIQTAEPVGSKTLVTKYELPYSSATIRNDMQLLEEMGYLEKTHTSSGRVPSVKGYHYYCEHLMEDKLDDQWALALNEVFLKDTIDLDEAIKQSCEILSHMTKLAAGALGSDVSVQRLKHIRLLPIDQKSAVCVFITNTGYTETKTFRFEEAVDMQDIQKCTDILNSRLENSLVDELPERLQLLKPILEESLYRHDLLFQAFFSAFMKFAREHFYYVKTSNLLYQPEFEDVERLKQLLRLIDNNSLWRREPSSNSLVMKTQNGSELSWDEDVAIVRSPFKVKEGEEGQLMIVGPSRMDYSKIVSLLEYVARMIEQVYGKGGNNE